MKNKILFTILFLTASLILEAQQPFKKYKPKPEQVDKFDHILSVHPFKFLATRINLAYEMRLHGSLTLKVRSSQNIYNREPFFIFVTNQEVSNRDFSEVIYFDEQNSLFLLKRYKTDASSRVFCGSYLAAGVEATRTQIKMKTESNNTALNGVLSSFSAKRQAVILAFGTTKLFPQNIIVDFSMGVKYQYKINDVGMFTIRGFGYKKDFAGIMSFSIGLPVGKRLNTK